MRRPADGGLVKEKNSEMDEIQKRLLKEVAELDALPVGAYNIRSNGKSAARNTTASIDIVTKQDKPGIDIIIRPGTKNQSVHIPVIISESAIYIIFAALSCFTSLTSCSSSILMPSFLFGST